MSEDVARELETLFDSGLAAPAGLAMAAGVVGDHVDGLADAERAAVVRAAERRRHEFATGRALARAAMARLGLPAAPIPRGGNRAPVWPEGCVGSITHAGPVAAAAVARRGAVGGLGIDLERADRVTPALHRKLFTPAEERAHAGADPRWPGLVFSAKEAAYKAVHPLVGRFITFHEVEVLVDWPTGTFALEYRGDHAPNRLLERSTGQFGFAGEFVFTRVIIP